MFTKREIAEMLVRPYPFKKESTREVVISENLQLSDNELMEKFQNATKGLKLIKVSYDQFTIL